MESEEQNTLLLHTEEGADAKSFEDIGQDLNTVVEGNENQGVVPIKTVSENVQLILDTSLCEMVEKLETVECQKMKYEVKTEEREEVFFSVKVVQSDTLSTDTMESDNPLCKVITNEKIDSAQLIMGDSLSKEPEMKIGSLGIISDHKESISEDRLGYAIGESSSAPADKDSEEHIRIKDNNLPKEVKEVFPFGEEDTCSCFIETLTPNPIASQTYQEEEGLSPDLRNCASSGVKLDGIISSAVNLAEQSDIEKDFAERYFYLQSQELCLESHELGPPKLECQQSENFYLTEKDVNKTGIVTTDMKNDVNCHFTKESHLGENDETVGKEKSKSLLENYDTQKAEISMTLQLANEAIDLDGNRFSEHPQPIETEVGIFTRTQLKETHAKKEQESNVTATEIVSECNLLTTCPIQDDQVELTVINRVLTNIEDRPLQVSENICLNAANGQEQNKELEHSISNEEMDSHALEEMAKSLLNEASVENGFRENLPPIETEERISTRTELEEACAEKEQEDNITANEMVSEFNLVTTSPRQGDKAEVTVVNRSLTNIEDNSLQIAENICLNAANGQGQNKELEHSIANEERGLHALDEMTKSLLNEASAENEFSENPQPTETEERISTRTELEEAYAEKEQEVDINANEMVSEYNLVTTSPRQDDQAAITVVNEVLRNGEDEPLKTAENVCLNAANGQGQNKELEHLIANKERSSHSLDELPKSLLNEESVENGFSENLQPIETEEMISTRRQLEEAFAEKEQEGDVTANEMVSGYNLVTTSPRQDDQAEVTVVNGVPRNGEDEPLKTAENICLNAANDQGQNKELEYLIANEERGLHAVDEMTKSLLNEASAENKFCENPQPIENEEMISTRTPLEEAYAEKEQEGDVTANEMVSEYNLVTTSTRQDDQAEITVVNGVPRNGEDEPLKTAENKCLNTANDHGQNKELEHSIANEERGSHSLDEMPKSLLNEASAENEFSENPQPIETEERISTRTQLEEAYTEKEQDGDVTAYEMVSEYNLTTSPTQVDQAEVTVVNGVLRNGEDELLKTAEIICLNAANDQGQNKELEHLGTNEEKGSNVLKEMTKSLLNETSTENTENISDHMYSLGFHLDKMSNSLGADNEETESIMQTHIGISFTANSLSDLDLISGNVLTLGTSNDSTHLNSYILDDDFSGMNPSVEETVLKDGDSRTLQDSSTETQLILSGKSFQVNHSSIMPVDFTYQNEINTNINLEEVVLTTEIPDSPNGSSVFTDDELSLSTSLQQGLQHLVLTCDGNEHFFNSSEEEFSLNEDKHWKKDSGIYTGFKDSEFITEPKTNANIFFSSIEKTIIGTHDTSTELNWPIEDTHENKFSELCNKQKEFNQISEEAEKISLSTDMVYIESKSDELLSKNVYLYDQVTCFTDSSNCELWNDSSKNTIESTVEIPFDLDMQNNKYSKDIENRDCEASELNLSDTTLQVHAFSLNHSEKTYSVFPEIHDDNLQLREHVEHKNSTFPKRTKASFSVNSERAESKTNTSICKDSVDNPHERPRIHVYCVIGQHMPISNVQEESSLIRAETESPNYQEEDKATSCKVSTNTTGDLTEDIQKHEDVHDNCSNAVPSTPGSKPFMYRQNAFEESASFNSVMAHGDQNNILEMRERETWTTEEFSNPSLLFSGTSAAPNSGKGTALPFYTTSSDDSSEAAPVELFATEEELKSADSGLEFSSIPELVEKVLQKGEASPKIMLGKAISWPCHGRESLRVHASEMVLENDEAQSFKNQGLQARKRRRGFRRTEKSVSCLDEKEQHDLDKDFSSSKGNDLDETVQRGSSKITPTCTQLYQEYDAVALERQIKRQARSDTLMDESSPPVNRKTHARNAPRLSLCSQTSQSLWQDLPGVRGSSHLEALSEKSRKLQEMKFELVSSEASYLHSLNIAVDHFQRSPALKAVLSPQDKMWLFSRLAEVREISYRFLADLEERVEQNVLMFDVCDIVLKHIPNFQSIYVPYLKNQSYQEKTFERLMETSSQFRRAVEELEKSPLCQRLPLRSFLVLPFQRITRLKLLVQNILKKTLPGSREEEQATSALHGLEKLIQQSNESIRQMRSIENLVSLSRRVDFQCRIFPLVSQARWLQKEGEVTHLLEEGNGRISKKSVYLHLFNDVLLLSHPKEGGRFSVFEYNSTRKLRVENCQMKLHSLQKNLFQLHLFETSEGCKASFVFRTEKQSEKFRWISALSPPPPKIDYFGCNDCKQVQCIRAYVAQQPDELSLEKADLLLVHQQTSDGWTEGTRVSDGERGWFPNSHIDLIVSHQARLRNLKERQRIVNATCRRPNS
ncbi:uncharacterized protein arhgef5 isoform X2 [Erpetoichthys calabaricus]|uniref:uncharacterized protein arhgef5 isoform X2 n=1 Tax=Erpetoichthys calabaricus TaxID=27687 RepID=UPI0022340C69|nr:uncharacterized protein arhgef5 isoform X2 [Erpetoichthys calabaricus]